MVAFGFISGMLMLKYKPVYAVTIDNTQVGYVVSKDEIEKNPVYMPDSDAAKAAEKILGENIII